MQISYRQGIISANAGFISNSQNAGYIDLHVTNAVVAAIAFGDRDYLISEEESVTNAWGPLSSSPVQYLFWDLNPYTGELTRGITDYAMVVSDIAPENPPVGLMWWNTDVNRMAVWSGASWKAAYRVLAGSVLNGSSIVAEPFASQVGLNSPANAGYILTDGYGSTFRDANGNFFTTETTSFQNDTGSLVKIGDAVLTVQANENIPAFSFVYLINGRAALASSSLAQSFSQAPQALVTEDTPQNSQCQLFLSGKQIFNQDWSFDASLIGKAVYCDSTGGLTFDEPQTDQFVRCGFVVNSHSIYLTFDTRYSLNPVDTGGSEVPPGSLSAVAPLHILTAGAGLEISIDKATSFNGGYISAADFSRIGAIESQLPTFALNSTVWPQAQVSGLSASFANKANLVHTHAQADVDGLVTDLANKAPLVHTHVITDITGLSSQLNTINVSLASKVNTVNGAVTGHMAAFGANGQIADSGLVLSNVATVNSTWPISSIVNLSTQLSSLAPLSYVWPTSQVAGLDLALANINNKIDKVPSATFGRFASFDSTGSLIDSGYNSSSFAPVNATWNISSVTGLQTALDNKAALVHGHGIADIVGLQTSLDNKLNLNATIPISQVVGLQSAINARVSKTGDTMTGDLTVPQIFVSGVSINSDGSFTLSNSKGTAGQYLKSNGAAAATWADLPSLSAPAGQIVVGTGGGMSGSTSITFAPVFGNDTLTVTGDIAATNALRGGSLNISGYASIDGSVFIGGTLALDGNMGLPGQVLQSNGVLDTPSWVNLPDAIAPSAPDQELVFGAGTSLTSSSLLKFDPSSQILDLTGDIHTSHILSATGYFSGNLNADNISTRAFTVAEDLSVGGNVSTSNIFLTGSAQVDGDVYATNATIAGALQVTVGNITASHDVHVLGALNAGTVNISSNLDASNGNVTAIDITATGELRGDFIGSATNVVANGDMSTTNIVVNGFAQVLGNISVVDINATGDVETPSVHVGEYLEVVGQMVIDGDIGLATGSGPDFGTAGQVLTSAGPGSVPTWTTLPEGSAPAISLGQLVAGTGTGIAGIPGITISDNYGTTILSVNGDTRLYGNLLTTGNVQLGATFVTGTLTSTDEFNAPYIVTQDFETDNAVFNDAVVSNGTLTLKGAIGLFDGADVNEGTAGQVLTSAGPGAAPTWVDAPGVGLELFDIAMDIGENAGRTISPSEFTHANSGKLIYLTDSFTHEVDAFSVPLLGGPSATGVVDNRNADAGFTGDYWRVYNSTGNTISFRVTEDQTVLKYSADNVKVGESGITSATGKPCIAKDGMVTITRLSADNPRGGTYHVSGDLIWGTDPEGSGPGEYETDE